VYLGDAKHLKALLPHPKAAIFVADFPNITALAQYLTYLTTNETAYEEHRAWRKGFTYAENVKNNPLLQHSWTCKVCKWAVETVRKEAHSADRDQRVKKRMSKCHRKPGDLASLNGTVVKGGGSSVFFVENGVRRPIPDASVFASLKLDWLDVISISDGDLNSLPLGPPMVKAGT
jgi:Glycosyltransferase family 10 (fucosyltransferase) C-term